MDGQDLLSEDIEIIVGTYEEFVLGYKLSNNDDSSGEGAHKYKLTQSFTNHSHSGSIRAVAVAGKYLASGSADEAIRLINMGLRIEHGYMQQQTGTITCITNYGSKYVFSGSTDGTICIWKCGSWICEKTLHAHVGGVLDISVHPSGKLALSVGMDKTLKTWNLIKGRTGFVTNLHGVGDAVRWSPEGTYYAVGISNRMDVYSVETAKVVYSVPFGKRVSCICFPNDEVVVLAGDKETVEVHDVKKLKKLSEFQAHKVRVKDMRFVKQHNLLVTGSNSDQFIKLWKFEDDSCSASPTLVTELDTTCRLTCLTVWSKIISKSHSDIATVPESITTTSIQEEEEESENELEISDDDVKEQPKSKLNKKSIIKTKTIKIKGKGKKRNSDKEEPDNSPTSNKHLASRKSPKIEINSQPPKKKKK